MAKMLEKATAAAIRGELESAHVGLISDQVAALARAIEVLVKAIER